MKTEAELLNDLLLKFFCDDRAAIYTMTAVVASGGESVSPAWVLAGTRADRALVGWDGNSPLSWEDARKVLTATLRRCLERLEG